jgi:hypothetical protein
MFLIKQPAGLGDILYCMKIGANSEMPVIWPVCDHYFNYISKYISCKNVTFVREDFKKEDYNIKRVIDLNRATYIVHPESPHCSDYILKDKYSMVSMDDSNWSDSVSLTRNFQRESKLITFLRNEGIKLPFVFVNNVYGTPPDIVINNHERIHYYKSNFRYHVVDMKKYFHLDFNIFDWVGVMELSETIITVQSAFQYLLELIDLPFAKNLYITQRFGINNYKYIDGIFNRHNWQLL